MQLRQNECREFTGLNFAYNFSKVRRVNRPLPLGSSSWTQVKMDLVVKCAVKFKGVALAQRMNETAKECGLKYRELTRQNVSNLVR